MSAFFPPGSPPQDVLGTQVGNLLARVRALEAVVASGGGGGGIQFTSGGVYGAHNYGAALYEETNSFTSSAFHFASNVTPDNVAGGGEPHSNKYGALFTIPIDAPFYVWALNVYSDARDPGSGFANGIEVVVGTDGPSAKGIDIAADSSDGTGIALGLSMSVSSDSGACTGIEISADNTGNTARAIKVTDGLCQLGLPTSAGPTGTLWNDTGTVKVA